MSGDRFMVQPEAMYEQRSRSQQHSTEIRDSADELYRRMQSTHEYDWDDAAGADALQVHRMRFQETDRHADQVHRDGADIGTVGDIAEQTVTSVRSWMRA